MLLKFLCLQLALFFFPLISFSTQSSRCSQKELTQAGTAARHPQEQTPTPWAGRTPFSMGPSSSSPKSAWHVIKKAHKLQTVLLNHFSISITLHGLPVLRAHIYFPPATLDLYKKMPQFPFICNRILPVFLFYLFSLRKITQDMIATNEMAHSI